MPPGAKTADVPPVDQTANAPSSVSDPTPDEEPAPPPKAPFSLFGRRKHDSDGDDKPPPPPKVKFFQLFKYTDGKEKAYMGLAVFAAAFHGSLLPLFTIIFGRIIDAFGKDDGKNLQLVGDNAKWFLILAVAAFFSSTIQVRFQLIVAQRLCARMRAMFFKSLMSQDFTWYNGNDGGELTTRVANDVNVIQSGVGDKVTGAIQFISTFIVGIIIAFRFGPLLTLVILAVAPLLIAGGAVFGKLAAESTGDGLGAYGAAGAVATEVIGLIRVVTAYNGQQTEINRYSKELDSAYRSNLKNAIIGGLGLGFTMFVIFCSYGIAFSFGAWQHRRDDIDVGEILVTFFSVIIACVSIGQGKFLHFPPLYQHLKQEPLMNHTC